MRLKTISEDSRTQRLGHQAQKVLDGLLGDIVADPAAVYHHLTRGVANVRLLLIADDGWWSRLFDLLEPLDRQTLEGFYEETAQHVTDLLNGQSGEQSAVTEGLVRGFLNLLKRAAFFLIKAAIAGLAAASHSDGCCSPPFAYTSGTETAQSQKYVGYLNLVAVSDFMGRVLDYAEEYRQGKANLRNRRREAPDAAGNDPREGQ
jgi:hypothetical protein